MKTFVYLVEKNKKDDDVVFKAEVAIEEVDKEKLHHPELRPQIEGALEDLHLQLSEGEGLYLSRIIGQKVTAEEMYDFEKSCRVFLDFISDLEIPAKEEAAIDEARQVVESATDEEIEYVKSWLEDLKDDELLCIEFISFWKNGLGHGRIAGALMKKLLTAFIQTYGQQG